MPKAVVTADSFDWGGDRAANTCPWSETVIYESPRARPEHAAKRSCRPKRGTFAALATPSSTTCKSSA
jgi:isoamylase